MAFIVSDREHWVLMKKVKFSGRWKNLRIANIFEYKTLNAAVKGLPVDIERLEAEIAELRQSLAGKQRQERIWILKGIYPLERSLQLRLKNLIKLIEFVDETEVADGIKTSFL